ncbi:aconitase family protein [Catenisphaera adipataccumulans]|jgi:3-isopropylmalate/(R)-2-methylmalate dehydratase large subunit|uniref:Homoaconitase/3-isopropylmalate dehydratase large subunit n=1 Tax=Catenisphaera adipataccumulans TaxID=700500 RepID=A0A7W8CXH7_9FIRM|nr:aconitase family protein [Catenisphaera adipataccumulans]MBB5183450.1 homoaconitase/3-isopropylmalate dehydratase large subunit [Catenisphaera adipataccumulans]
MNELTFTVDAGILNDTEACASLIDTTAVFPLHIIIDQHVPASDETIQTIQERLKKVPTEHYTYGQGKTAHILREQKLSSGSVVISCDPEIGQIGGFGCMGLTVSPEQFRQSAASGTIEFPDAQIQEIHFVNELPEFVSAKDLALCIIAKMGDLDFSHSILFLRGKSLSVLTEEDKMELCGMLSHIALSAVITKDKVVKKELGYDVSDTISMAVTPSLKEVYAMKKQDVDLVYIGGTYGGTLTDLELAAKNMRGLKVSLHTQLYVAPASQTIYEQAAQAGYLAVLEQAGATILPPCYDFEQIPHQDTMRCIVSNDIQDRRNVILASTQIAIFCALRGCIGEKE